MNSCLDYCSSAMISLVRPPGLADNAGTGRTSIWTHAETHCAISNTSLLLAREIHPDKTNFALEHCPPAPTVGNPFEWQMNGHLSGYNWPLKISWLVLQTNFKSVSMMTYGNCGEDCPWWRLVLNLADKLPLFIIADFAISNYQRKSWQVQWSCLPKTLKYEKKSRYY